MTAPTSIDPARLLHEQLDNAAPDLLRHLLGTFIDAPMGAEADALCGEDRVNVGNGYRHRPSDTRAGTLDVAIPELRSGIYFPDWLLERRRRGRAGADQCGRDLLPARGVDPADGAPGGVPWGDRAVDVPGQCDGR